MLPFGFLKKLEKRLARLAKAQPGRTKTYYAREANLATS